MIVPFKVVEVEVILLADPVTVEYGPNEEDEASDDELEDDVPDTLKITEMLWFFFIFTLQS